MLIYAWSPTDRTLALVSEGEAPRAPRPPLQAPLRRALGRCNRTTHNPRIQDNKCECARQGCSVTHGRLAQASSADFNERESGHAAMFVASSAARTLV
jgi:hypothetical protein